MLLSEQIQLKKSEDLSNLCHLAKNLYNHANYLVRHRYFFLLNPDRLDFKWLKELKDDLISKCSNVSNISHITKKYVEIKNNLIHKYNKISGKQGYGGIGKFMSYQELWALMKYISSYKSLSAQSAQSILLLVENDWRSYFKRKDAYYKAKKELPFEEFKKIFNSIPKIPRLKRKTENQ